MEKGDIMKSIKKYILIITMALLTLTLSACSKVTPEQALNKVAEASKNIKNTEFSVIVSTESTSGDKTRKIEAKITGAVINEPLAIHANTEIKSTRTTLLDMYIKDNVLYAKNDGREPWLKTSDSKFLSRFESYKQITNSEKAMEFYKKNTKDFKMTEENGNYVLTYSGNGDQFKDLMNSLIESSGGQLNAKAFNDIEFKNVNIKLVVSKDFNPVSNEVTMEIAKKNSSTPTSLKLVQSVTYSKINQVNSIDLPEATKNAKEIKKTS